MKRLSVIATIAALALIVTACGKENGAATNENTMGRAAVNQQQWQSEEVGISVDYSEIAPEIMLFVETHFPQTSI